MTPYIGEVAIFGEVAILGCEDVQYISKMSIIYIYTHARGNRFGHLGHLGTGTTPRTAHNRALEIRNGLENKPITSRNPSVNNRIALLIEKKSDGREGRGGDRKSKSTPMTLIPAKTLPHLSVSKNQSVIPLLYLIRRGSPR